MGIENKNLKRTILEVSFKYGLSHLGSCLTAVDIIAKIYEQKKDSEPFILSSGHAGLALYSVLSDKYKHKTAEEIFNHHGVHPDRCADCYLDCSTGSLGQGLPIAVGMALADRSKDVYCLVSDGEMQEGSCHEAAEVMFNEKVTNLKVYINCNGWGAYKSIDFRHLKRRFEAYYDQNIFFKNTNCDYLPFLKGQDAHYHTMTEAELQDALEILK